MYYIVLEGPEGGGKTTLLQLLKEALTNKGYEVLTCREPGETTLGKRIREVLLDPEAKISGLSEVYLFNADRSELIRQVIAPALESGKVVISDRSYLSTYAYQIYGRDLDPRKVKEITEPALRGNVPDLAILLDISAKQGLKRRRATGDLDRLDQETLEFHKRVRRGFLEMTKGLKGPEWLVVDATKTPEETLGRVLNHLLKELKSPEGAD